MDLRGTIEGLLQLEGAGSEVTVTPLLNEGVQIARIKVDNNTYIIFAPDSSGGGSDVDVTPILLTGTKIADIEVDGVVKSIFAPTPTAPTEVSVSQELTEGTKIGEITVDGVTTSLYAPSGGSGGSYSITPLSNIGAQDIGTLTLNDSILNYDAIVVECCRDTSPSQRGNIWLPTAIIDQLASYRKYRVICPHGSQNVDGCFDFYFQNNNQIVKSYANASFFYGCYGIKF